MASLTCGEPGGPDANAVASVVITPGTGSVDTGDSLHLSAVARNSAGTDLSGKTITWTALDATLVTVGGSGTVHGHWPGQARVVATSEGKADTATIQVIPRISRIVVTAAYDTLRALSAVESLHVRAFIDTQPYPGGSYTWDLSNPLVAHLFVGGPDSVRLLSALANGDTYVRVVEARGARDSARVVVRQRPKTIFFVSLLRGYRACPFRVMAQGVGDSLNYIIPGAQVTWRSSDTTLARIDSTGLITPLAPGVDTIVAQSGPASRSAALTITVAPSVTLQALGGGGPVTTVGRGQFASGYGSLGGASSDAPARFSIVSSDTTILAVPSDTSVPYGGQPGFGPLRLVGRANGTVTLTPYLCDVPGSSVAFTVTRPKFALYQDLVPTARIDDPARMLRVLTQDSTGALHATVNPVTVWLTATDTTVIRPDSVYRHVAANNVGADFFVTFPESGSARLHIRDSTGLYLPDSTVIVHVAYPPIYFNDNLYSLGDTLRVGMRQRVYPPPIHPYSQRPIVVLDRNVVGAPIPIHLSTSDSLIARLSPDSAIIPVGESTAPIDIVGGDVRGSATLTARAFRHTDGHLVVKTDRPAVGFYNWGSGEYPGDSMRVELFAYDSATFVRGYPTENVTFTLSVNDTSVVSIGSTTLTIPAGAETSAVVFAHLKRAGTATVTATDPRAVPYAYAPATTPPVTVLAPYLSVDSTISLGVRQSVVRYVLENGPPQGAVVVHMQQRNPAVVSLSDTVFTIGADSTFHYYSAVGLASGVDTVVVSAAGFTPDTSIITVGPGKILLGNWPSTVAVGDSFPEWIYILDPNGQPSTTADTLVVTLASNSNLEFRQNGVVITTVTIPAGQTYSQTDFYVKAKAAGTGSVTITAPNYTPLTQTITVAP